MTSDIIIAVVSSLLSGGLVTAFIMLRQDKRREPIERTQAEEASAKIASEIRSADIDVLRDIIVALREELTRAQEKIARLEKRVEIAEQRADIAEQKAEDAERRLDNKLNGI